MSLPPRFARKPDANQAVIISSLEKVGALVYDLSLLGGGFPDLIVGYKGCLYLLEVKVGKRKLNRLQKILHRKWEGYFHVVRSPEEALRVLGINCG